MLVGLALVIICNLLTVWQPWNELWLLKDCKSICNPTSILWIWVNSNSRCGCCVESDDDPTCVTIMRHLDWYLTSFFKFGYIHPNPEDISELKLKVWLLRRAMQQSYMRHSSASHLLPHFVLELRVHSAIREKGNPHSCLRTSATVLIVDANIAFWKERQF